jgi:ABC-type sugar transport system ATPase subunit
MPPTQKLIWVQLKISTLIHLRRVAKHPMGLEDSSVSDVILECRNLSKSFDQIEALKDVSFKLMRGEVLGLVGDNGAGKSTLIKILRGVIRPTSGEIYIEGKKKMFNSPRDAIREGIQCVYQEAALVEQLSVAENFFIGQEPVRQYARGLINFVDFGKMEKDSDEYLARMGFHLNVTDEIRHFSGGERQAVAVMRALYFTPKILFLDEPTTALSEKAKRALFDLLRTSKKVCPMIFVTHDLNDAIELCDRIIMLKLGEIAFEFKAREGLKVEEILRYM